MTTKPVIILHFDGDTVDWMSDGWGHNPELMRVARKLINKGATPAEVIELLSERFEVHHDA